MFTPKAQPRIDSKRRAVLDPRKRQFAKAPWVESDYSHRMNFYLIPPTGDVSLEDFEEWAIARLKVLAELEACQFRNKSAAETEEHMRPVLERHMRLSSNMSRSGDRDWERKKDHYSHWTLRLAFSSTAELRQRFARLETQLFRLRLGQDDGRERKAFIDSLSMNWALVDESEKASLVDELKAATGWHRGEEENWFKTEWEKVSDLVERRQCLLKMGQAYVHVREQQGMVVQEFGRQLESALTMSARFLPQLDEDNRVLPILHHLSQSFVAPDAGYNESSSIGDLTVPTAASIDALSVHFPLCMRQLHMELRRNGHLKHFGRLQYTLFLKGIGLSLPECIIFWRKSFRNLTDEKFKSEYLYNVRHAYGDVGGDANRRSKGATPYSCQKLLTEALPSGGQSHGCPYRTHGADNLMALLQSTGVTDKSLLQAVQEDVGKQRYHIACNRVFEHTHKAQLKRVKDQNLWPASELDTILHPNTYFKRAFMLSNLDKFKSGDIGVDG
ncbi:DNA primase, partial [Piedraia hortae CBS 480.64]